ncbi:MAG: radical SAM protein [Candidatus Omnitrophica bacterium]|nr:radical SAM protein [Candidatus Omnitrophota bacterium]
MKIALIERIDARRRVNKDQMGGYGIGFAVSRDPVGRFIAWNKRRRNVPVLALGYLAAIFRQAGHEIEVISDGRLPDGADLTLIYASIVECHGEIAYARRVKAATRSHVGFVGPFASQKPELFLDAADFLIQGEPEAAARRLARGELPRGVAESPQLQDLDSLPYPAWDAFPLADYSYYPLILDRPFVSVQGSRGCDFLCSYCPYAAYYGKVRQRSVEHVLGELRHLVERYGVRGIEFRDPLFTVNRAWVVAFAQALRQAKLPIRWGCETRMDLLDAELIDLLYAAGMRSINCGVESASPEVLKSARRTMSFPKLEQEIRNCERKGIRVAAFYVLGLPADTTASIRETLRYAGQLNTYVAQFHINTPFPGTQMYEQLRNQIVETNWERFDSFTPVFRHPNLSSDELVGLRREAFVSYYFRPAYLRKHRSGLAQVVGSWWAR